MNKPKFEARGKKHNRGQAPTPDQELKDMLSQTQPPISQGLGISQEALNTEGFSTAEVMNRQPLIEEANLDSTALAASAAEVQDNTIVNAAPGFKLGGQPFVPLGEPEDRYQGPGEDGHADVSSIRPVEEVTEAQIVAGLNDTMSSGDAVIARLRALPSEGVTPKMLADVMLGNVTPADGAELREQYYEIHGGEPVVMQQAQPVVDAEEDPPMYYQEDLIIVIMRHRAKDPDEDRARMRRMLSAFVDRISGLNTGFKVIPAPGSNPAKLAKPQYEATSSTVKLDYTERKGKIFAKFFESWGVDISRFGLNDNTTVDFFVIEPSKDGKTVLDAWNCTGMHPYYMGTVEADTYYDHKQLRQVTQFQVVLNGNVRRGTVEIEAAQGLLDDLNAQLAAGA
jgi:hypothetical protein